jgi:hypothetical protein
MGEGGGAVADILVSALALISSGNRLKNDSEPGLRQGDCVRPIARSCARQQPHVSAKAPILGSGGIGLTKLCNGNLALDCVPAGVVSDTVEFKCGFGR